MADLQELLQAIPEGGQYDLIRAALNQVDRLFPEQMAEIDLARVQRFVSDVDAGTRSGDQIRDDIFKYIVEAPVIMQRLGVDAATAEKLISGEQQFANTTTAAGDLGTTRRGIENVQAPLTLLYSPSMKWYKDPDSNQYYVSYKLPNGNHEYLFEAEDDQIMALFGTNPPQAEQRRLNQIMNQGNVTFGGNVSEMEGRGSFDTEIARIKTTALDNGQLPEWLKNDPAAMDLVVIGQLEDKSMDWVVEQVAKLPSFIKRFPGIENFKKMNLTTAESVRAFQEYENGLRQLEKQQGRDGSRITPEIVGELAGQGYSFEQVQQTYTVFKRMDDFAPAMEAFNQVLAANGREPLTSTKDKFEFLNGTAPAEVYDIYEAASFRETAETAGIGEMFSASKALDAALQTPGMLSQERITAGMQQAAQLVLRLRAQVATEKYGLNNEDLIDISLGLRPASGASEAEIQENISRAVQEAQGFLRNRTRPYTSFSEDGKPRAQSIAVTGQKV